MAKVVIVGVEAAQTEEDLNELLRRDYGEMLYGDIVTSSEKAGLYIRGVIDPILNEVNLPVTHIADMVRSEGCTVGIVADTTLRQWALAYSTECDAENPWVVIQLSIDNKCVLRPRNEVFPQFKLRSLLNSIADEILSKPKPFKNASIKPMKAPMKFVTELNKSLDEYKERMTTAIDRSQSQTEERLKKIENVLYRKSQEKLQKLDDCEKTIEPLTSDLEALKRAMETPSRQAAIRKRLDNLNSLLSRCQTDLKELERTRHYDDDQSGKPLPLHILKEVEIINSVIHVKVVNLKEGRFEEVVLEVKDELGVVESEVRTILPGLQTIDVRLAMDLYVVKQVDMVFKRGDRQISNRLVIDFEDARIPEVMKDEEPVNIDIISEISPRKEEGKEAWAASLPLPSHKYPYELSQLLSGAMESNPELTEKEQEMYQTLEAFFGEDFMREKKPKFLSIIRSKHPFQGESLDVQQLGALLSDTLPR